MLGLFHNSIRPHASSATSAVVLVILCISNNILYELVLILCMSRAIYDEMFISVELDNNCYTLLFHISTLMHYSSIAVYNFILLTIMPLPSTRQHPSYGDCLKVKREYYQNCSVLDCVTQCSQSTAHLYEQFLQVPTDWVCHIGTLMLCVEAVAYSCIIVTWWSGSGGIQAWSWWPTGFLQCSDTVGLVIWPVKIVPEMTYNVLSGTLSLYSTTYWIFMNDVA